MIPDFDIALAFLLFMAYIIVDGLYAYYTYAIIKRTPFRAATSGMVIHFILAFGVISYVENFWYVIPLACGSWVGTYSVTRYELARTGGGKMMNERTD